MKSFTNEEFDSWAVPLGIGPDKRGGEDLGFPSDDRERFARFWEFPKRKWTYKSFLSKLLDAMDPWSGCYVYFAWISWYDPNRDEYAYVWDRDKLASIGVPVDHHDIIVWFEKSDAKLMMASLKLQMENLRDCYVVPDHGNQIVHLTHHAVAKVLFRDESRLRRYVEALADRRVLLPKGPPDATFKPQPWFRGNNPKG